MRSSTIEEKEKKWMVDKLLGKSVEVGHTYAAELLDK